MAKAHIVPQPFFTKYTGRANALRLVTNTRNSRPKKAPAGVYDEGILCQECDRRLGVWDQHGIDLFLRELDSLDPVPNARAPIVFRRQTFNYRRLRLFILSVLWRAHASTQETYSRVDLGRHASRLKRLVLDGNADDPSEFSVVLSVFTFGGVIPKVGIPILDPHRDRWDGISAYRLPFGVVTAYVKVDARPFHDPFASIVVRPDQPLTLVQRDFETSVERRVAQAIMRAPQNRNLFK